MNKLNKVLIALALAQGGLLMVVHLAHRDTNRTARHLLPNASKGAITAMKIWGPPMQGMKDGQPTIIPGASITLARLGDRWVMNSHDNHPVDHAKIEALIAALVDAEASAPLTNDLTKHASLRVGDSAYDRKLTVTIGGREQTMFIGLTAGQTAAVRVLGKPEVYESTRITPWSVASEPAGWMQKIYAQYAPVDLQAVEITNQNGTWRFDRGSGDWSLSLGGAAVIAPAGAQLDQEIIRRLPNLVANLTAVSPADPAFVAPATASKTVLTVHAARQAAPQRFDLIEAGTKYYWLRARDRADAVLIPREPISHLIGLSINTVTRAASATQPTP